MVACATATTGAPRPTATRWPRRPRPPWDSNPGSLRRSRSSSPVACPSSSSSRRAADAVAADDPAVVRIESDGHEAIRKIPSTVVHDVGVPAEDPFYRPNFYKFQDVNAWKDLGPKLALQAWRDFRATGDRAGLEAAWPAIRAVLEALAAHDLDDDGLPEHDGTPDQTYDTWPMRGPSAYGGSLWLGALAAAHPMAGRLGKTEAGPAWAGLFEGGPNPLRLGPWESDHYAYHHGGGGRARSINADQPP